MYSTVLWLHSHWRWMVLLSGAIALGWTTLGWARGWPWTRRAQSLHTAFVGSVDLQLLLGLILYVFVSPFTLAAFSDLGQALKNPHYRFWAVEHGPVQLLAVVVAHLGKRRVKRAVNDHQRHRGCAIFTGIAILLILAAIPWPGLDIARPLFRRWHSAVPIRSKFFRMAEDVRSLSTRAPRRDPLRGRLPPARSSIGIIITIGSR